MNELITEIEKPELKKEKTIEKEKELIQKAEEEEKVELFRCDIRNQEFATEKGLKIHKKKKHPNAGEASSGVVETGKTELKEKLECPVCMKKYNTQIWFDKHIRDKHPDYANVEQEEVKVEQEEEKKRK